MGARTASLLPGTSILFGPPRKVATTSTQANRSALVRHALVPARTSIRTIPEMSDPPLDKWMQKPCHADIKEIFVAELPKGRYWGRYHGYVIDQTDTLLTDVSPTYTAVHARHDGLNHLKLPPLRELKGTVAVINTSFSDNFHHWLLDTVPRFEWLRRAGWAWKDIDYFILPGKLLKFHWETLEILGIDKSKIIPSTPELHVRADRLLAPCHSEPSALPLEYDYTPEGLQFVRSLFLTNNPFLEQTRSTKILVSREKAGARRIVQAERANQLLFEQGFEKVLLEDHSVREQAAIFNHADCVIMPTGGNLANFVFCRPGTVAIELFSKNYIPPFTFSLMDNIGLRYYGLVADKISRPTPEARTSSEDIDFDPDRLAATARQALAQFGRT
jgi:capsular polysaccharide biosynthesis protein